MGGAAVPLAGHRITDEGGAKFWILDGQDGSVPANGELVVLRRNRPIALGTVQAVSKRGGRGPGREARIDASRKSQLRELRGEDVGVERAREERVHPRRRGRREEGESEESHVGILPRELRADLFVVRSMAALLALTWQIVLFRDLTVHDPVRVTISLVNVSTTETLRVGGGEPEILLTPEGKETRRWKLRPDGIALRAPQGLVEPGQVALQASLDLRKVFGKLPAGRYSLQVVMPGAPSSETVTFEIVEASFEDAVKAHEPAEGLEFTVKEGRGVLTNRRKEAIRFLAYGTGGDGTKFVEPLPTLLHWERWHPKLGWIAVPMGYCGTGLGTFVLEPGKSCELELVPTDCGIFRYVLHCQADSGAAMAKSNPLRAE